MKICAGIVDDDDMGDMDFETVVKAWKGMFKKVGIYYL